MNDMMILLTTATTLHKMALLQQPWGITAGKCPIGCCVAKYFNVVWPSLPYRGYYWCIGSQRMMPFISSMSYSTGSNKQLILTIIINNYGDIYTLIIRHCSGCCGGCYGGCYGGCLHHQADNHRTSIYTDHQYNYYTTINQITIYLAMSMLI